MDPLHGYHLIVDGAGRRPDLWNVEDAEKLLRELVVLAEMKLIMGPNVHERHSLIVGLAVLAESHTSLHLDRKTGTAFVDLFSCKAFPEAQVSQLIRDRLDLDHSRAHTFYRGLAEPKPVA